MTIASAIATKQQQVADSYTAVSNKGGTLPATQNLTNLATAISSIPTGGTPTLITKSITANGTYNASSDNADGYSSVTVDVSASKYGVTIDNMLGNPNGNGVLQAPSGSFTLTLPSNITDVGNYALYYKFSSIKITTADLSSLTTLSGYYACEHAFYNCTSLTSVNHQNLTTISGDYALSYTYSYCTNLTSVNFPSLTTVSGSYGCQNMLYNCTNLTSVNYPSLTTISGSNAFSNKYSSCSKLRTVNYPSLTTISGSNALSYAFRYDSKLEDVYFNALTTSSFGSYVNQFTNMLSGTGTTVTHTIHFPSNLQSTISGLTGYPNFGGTSGYVTLSFDLPATS